MEGVRAAVAAGFRVTTNTTLFDGADPNSVRRHFDQLMEAGVEHDGLARVHVRQGAGSEALSGQAAQVEKDVPAILSNRKKILGVQCIAHVYGIPDGQASKLTCTPWGMPTFSIFGWQKPCYLLQDGYADTFQELMEATEWENYGTEERQSALRRTAWCTRGMRRRRWITTSVR